MSEKQKLILSNWQSPGDIIVMSAAIRDLHKAYPNQYITDVRTPCPAIFENNPYITILKDDDTEVKRIDLGYPTIHQVKSTQHHFLGGFRMDLETQLGISIPAGNFKGDIHLSPQERTWTSQVEEITKQPNSRFWIINAGGKSDFTAKIWDYERFQEVVDYFNGQIQFVQVGEAGHIHKPLNNVINLLGATDLRQMIRLMYHADGVVCGVTMHMHLAAAVDTKPGRPFLRPCVVIAGGREEDHWEKYPAHQYLHTISQLKCCQNGGCWHSRVVPLFDGDDKDNNLCERPTQLPNGNVIPKCLDLIKSADVIRAIEGYLEFDKAYKPQVISNPNIHKRTNIMGEPLNLHKGYGDVVNALYILNFHKSRGYQYKVRSWSNDLNWLLSACSDTQTPGNVEIVWTHNTHLGTENVSMPWLYNEVFKNIEMYPLNSLNTPAETLWNEFISMKLPELNFNPEDTKKAEEILKDIPRPITMLHPRGWSYANEKSIPISEVNKFANKIVGETGGSVIVLDHYKDLEPVNNNRVIKMVTGSEDGKLTFRMMAELIRLSDVFVGIDSGPLHLARMVNTTPTIGLWMSRHCYPTKWTLPGENRWNLVPSDYDDWTNQVDRNLWGIRDGGTNTITPEKTAELVQEIIESKKL